LNIGLIVRYLKSVLKVGQKGKQPLDLLAFVRALGFLFDEALRDESLQSVLTLKQNFSNLVIEL